MKITKIILFWEKKVSVQSKENIVQLKMSDGYPTDSSLVKVEKI